MDKLSRKGYGRGKVGATETGEMPTMADPHLEGVDLRAVALVQPGAGADAQT